MPNGSDPKMIENSQFNDTPTSVPPVRNESMSSTIGVIPITNTIETTISPTASPQESSLNEDLIGILNDVTEYLVSVAVPVAIVVGSVLVVSILIAICNLCMKRKKSKQFEVGDRFKFRYGSERRHFLKNGSKPVILEADQKSLSIGGTPQHRANKPASPTGQSARADYHKLTPMELNDISTKGDQMTTSFASRNSKR